MVKCLKFWTNPKATQWAHSFTSDLWVSFHSIYFIPWYSQSLKLKTLSQPPTNVFMEVFFFACFLSQDIFLHIWSPLHWINCTFASNSLIYTSWPNAKNLPSASTVLQHYLWSSLFYVSSAKKKKMLTVVIITGYFFNFFRYWLKR